MIRQKIISLFITSEFEETINDFLDLVNDDADFKFLLKERLQKDKRLRNNKKIDSMKIRFAISSWVIKNKEKILIERMKKIEEQTEKRKANFSADEKEFIEKNKQEEQIENNIENEESIIDENGYI
jgi:hypothetical protein